MSEDFAVLDLRIGGEDALERGLTNVTKAVVQMTREVGKLHRLLADTVRREAKRGEVAHISAEEAKVAATRKAVADSNRFVVQSYRDQIKTLGDAVKEHQRAEAEKTAATKREAAERAREEARQARTAASEARATAAMRRREDRETEASIRRAGATLANADRKAAKRAEAVALEATNTRREYGRNVLGGAWSGARGAVGTLAGTAAVAGGGAMAYGLGAAGYQAELASRASSIAIATRDKTGSLDANEMVSVAQQIASKQGTKPAEVLESIMAAAEHGQGRVGAEMFLKKLPTYAALGLATDTNLADLAENSAAMTSMGIRDPEAQQRIMLKVAGASKEGNIGLREMGQNLSAAAGATEGYAGTAEERFVQASALMQLARGSGAKSAEDAGTATRNFFNDIANKSGDLKALGVETTDKKTGLRRNAFDQYADAVDKAKGDPEKLKGILGMQSRSIGQGIEAAYRRGGRPEVERELKRYTDAGMTPEEVQGDAAVKMKDSSVRFNAELEKLRAAVGQKMLPLLVDHMPKMSEAVEKIVKAVGDPENVQKFGHYIDLGVKALELFVKHPVLTGAAFVGIKTAMGGIEALASTWLGKNLFAPVTNVSAGVVNVVGGGKLPGVGDIPGKGAGGVGGIGGFLRTAVTANPIGLGVAAGLAIGHELLNLDQSMRNTSPGYKKWMDDHGVLRDAPPEGMFRSHEKDPLVGRDEQGRIMGRTDPSRGKLEAMLFDGFIGTPGKTGTMAEAYALRGAMVGNSMQMPSLTVGRDSGALGNEVKLAPNTEVVVKDMDKLIRAAKGGRDPAGGEPMIRVGQ